jgi:predicted nucleotidyltransferase
MTNYTRNAKKLKKHEQKAVNTFITKVILNLEDKLDSVILFGSAIYKTGHNDVDLAITVNGKLEFDPYTLKKNEHKEKVTVGDGPYSSALEELSKSGTLIENEIELNGAKIHYLIMEKDPYPYNVEGYKDRYDGPELIKNRLYCECKKESLAVTPKGIEPVTRVFLKAIFEDGIILYKRNKKGKWVSYPFGWTPNVS